MDFGVAWRGYDRDQVDEYIAKLEAGVDPATLHGFNVVRRGYNRDEVDAWLRWWRQEHGYGAR